MPRIRTIKPEFWTDSKIVQLPYEARLLFIGMWNFCDDDGCLSGDIMQLKLQILPADNVDIDLLLDLLIAAELVDRLILENGDHALIVRHFRDHQKVSHPSPSKLLPFVVGKKQPIPARERRDLAVKYGLKPGEHINTLECFYCGAKGRGWWPLTSTGQPGYWVGFSLTIDHFIPESSGGDTTCSNFVLSCGFCNKSKGVNDGIEHITQGHFQNPREPFALNRTEGKGKEGKGIEGREKFVDLYFVSKEELIVNSQFIFGKLNHRGEGQLLWKIAALWHLGQISEAEICSAAQSAIEKGRDRPKCFFGAVRNQLKQRDSPADLPALLQQLRLSDGDWPTLPPEGIDP